MAKQHDDQYANKTDQKKRDREQQSNVPNKKGEWNPGKANPKNPKENI
jgi:hypothetical protein